MHEVTLRFKTEDPELVKNLVTAWLEDEGIRLGVAGRQPRSINLTYVKEREVETVRACDLEFGEHEHDDAACARILDEMGGGSILEQARWEQEALNREAEEEKLGRPLFPNER